MNSVKKQSRTLTSSNSEEPKGQFSMSNDERRYITNQDVSQNSSIRVTTEQEETPIQFYRQ